MAARTARGSNSTKLVNLHDDFNTWWSGVHWSWDSSKYEQIKPAHDTPITKKEVLNISSGLKAAGDAREFHTPISNGTLASSQPEIDFAEAGLEEVPLYTIAPFFEVRRSPKGGYGAFALQDIAPYTEVFFEKPLLQAGDCTILECFRKLSDEDKKVYMKLASYDKLDANKVVAIFKTNRFRTYGGNCGIYPIATRFNHACIPLCTYQYKLSTEEMVLTTKSATINKGQEITISYGQTGDELLENYGFICDCNLCSIPGW